MASKESKPLDILKKGLVKLKKKNSKLKKSISKPSFPGRNPLHHQMSDGWTMKETPLTSNVSLTPLSHPPITSEGWKTWTNLERSSLKSYGNGVVN